MLRVSFSPIPECRGLVVGNELFGPPLPPGPRCCYYCVEPPLVTKVKYNIEQQEAVLEQQEAVLEQQEAVLEQQEAVLEQQEAVLEQQEAVLEYNIGAKIQFFYCFFTTESFLFWISMIFSGSSTKCCALSDSLGPRAVAATKRNYDFFVLQPKNTKRKKILLPPEA